MGVVMGGLTVGFSAALVGTVYLIEWAEPSMGVNAWKAPFLILGTVTIIAAYFIRQALKPQERNLLDNFGKDLLSLLKYALVFLVAIMVVYFITNALHLNDVIIAVILTCLAVQSFILFVSGLIFFALQAVAHALTSELAPVHLRGAAFGMLNLVSEIGAVLSPVVSGAIRDSTGSWGTPLILDGVLMGISCIMIMGVSAKIVDNSRES